MSVGLFGYDMLPRLVDCQTQGCRSNYDNYDGWSQGAYMKFSYFNGLTTYQNFGACWDDQNCWGAWLKFDSAAGEYLSTEISFKYTGQLS